MRLNRLLALLALAVAPRLSIAQERGAAALGDAVLGLGTTARVLVIAAHPDDEDTQLIAWLTKGRHVETAYLSLTRGDGGQNLIGNELGEALGVIRTEELLAARRIDGGRQFFTRAYDFGFSKSAEETFEHWPKDSILQDVVTVVRAFRPHVIVAMFSGTPADGHGHHQASGILAREAFDAAADTVRFPRASTAGLGAWAPLKFYRGRYRVEQARASLVFNVGEYSPLLGRSYAEIAAESRSQHRSQGFGQLQNRGVQLSWVKLEATRTGANVNAGERTLFDGVDTSWARFRGSGRAPASVLATLDSMRRALVEVRRRLDLVTAQSIVPPLSRYLRLAQHARSQIGCPDEPVPRCDGGAGSTADLAVSLNTTIRRATRSLLQASGVVVDATAERELVAMRDSVRVTVTVFNQGRSPVRVDEIDLPVWWDAERQTGKAVARTIAPDSALREQRWYAPDPELRGAWWLRRARVGDVFQLAPLRQAGGTPLVVGEERVHASSAIVRLRIGEAHVPVEVAPIVYRYADPVLGERRRPIRTAPPIELTFDRRVAFGRANAPADLNLQAGIRSWSTSELRPVITAVLPRELRADSATPPVVLPPLGRTNVSLRLKGTLPPDRYRIGVDAVTGQASAAGALERIEYEHIRPQVIEHPPSVELHAIAVTVPASLRVGYIQGVGDNVAPVLQQLGVPVTVLDPQVLPRTDLSRFTTIVVGPRAYEAHDALAAHNALLLDFARRGGTLVVQYGQYEMTRPGIMPFPVTLARPAVRVTREDAPMRILDGGSPLLTIPNAIGARDFDGWVQERSIYMPSTFDRQYRTVVSVNDPGEPPNDGGILWTPLGGGTYVYTTLAFFRQLPAGNPGAVRLFVNLLAAGRR